jgi:hypothetical protein
VTFRVINCIIQQSAKIELLENKVDNITTLYLREKQIREELEKQLSERNSQTRKIEYENEINRLIHKFTPNNRIQKRAMRIINECVGCEYPTRINGLQGADILKNDADDSYKIPDDTNVSKAMSDVFAKVVGIARKYGLGFSWDKMQKKMLVLKYEPAKNKHPIKDVLKMLNEGLKEKYGFRIPIFKRKKAFKEPEKSEEDKPISLNELADKWCPDVKKKVVVNESGTLLFKDLLKQHFPSRKEPEFKREYRGSSIVYLSQL